MATKAERRIPEGMNTITAYLFFNGNARKAIEFYDKAFGIKLMGDVVSGPNDTVLHAMLKLGDTNLMISDVQPDGRERGPSEYTTVSFWIYSEDCDALFQQAISAGCTQESPMEDQFWGDRMGKVRDPYGHCWMIASHMWIYSEEEMQTAMEKLGGWV
jgi:PhnB protein